MEQKKVENNDDVRQLGLQPQITVLSRETVHNAKGGMMNMLTEADLDKNEESQHLIRK